MQKAIPYLSLFGRQENVCLSPERSASQYEPSSPHIPIGPPSRKATDWIRPTSGVASRGLPVSGSHTLTAPYSVPTARRFPSGENATAVTGLCWGGSCLI